MKERRDILISLLLIPFAGFAWLILGFIYYIQTGDITFMQVGVTVFVLMDAVLAIYFANKYLVKSKEA